MYTKHPQLTCAASLCPVYRPHHHHCCSPVLHLGSPWWPASAQHLAPSLGAHTTAHSKSLQISLPQGTPPGRGQRTLTRMKPRKDESEGVYTVLTLGLFIKVQPICLTANFRIPYSTCVLWVDYWAIIRQDRTTTENSQRRIVYSKPSFWHQQKG